MNEPAIRAEAGRWAAARAARREIRLVRTEASRSEQEHLLVLKRGKKLGHLVGTVAAIRPKARVHASGPINGRRVHLAHASERKVPLFGQRIGHGVCASASVLPVPLSYTMA